MATKIKTLEDCRSGREMAEFIQAQEVEVRKVGSYLEVLNEKGEVYVPDSARDMPKPVRENIVKMLQLIGIGITALVMILALVGMGAL